MSFSIQQGIRNRPYLFVISLGNRCFERLSQVKFFLDFITSFPSKRRKISYGEFGDMYECRNKS